jgi:hypothetical protein
VPNSKESDTVGNAVIRPSDSLTCALTQKMPFEDEDMSKSIMIAFASLYAVLFFTEPATAQRVAFNNVRIRFNTNDRKQVDLPLR